MFFPDRPDARLTGRMRSNPDVPDRQDALSYTDRQDAPSYTDRQDALSYQSQAGCTVLPFVFFHSIEPALRTLRNYRQNRDSPFLTGGQAMKRKRHPGTIPQDPSRRDIRRACERIQSRWSDNERQKRAGASRLDPWLPPLIPSYAFGSDFEVECEN